MILDNSQHFIVQENIFSENLSSLCPNPSTVGIWTKDAGELPNEIYKNSFDGLDIGNWARGKNRSIFPNGLFGLEYLCNSNSNNLIDFFFDGTPLTDGIKLEQGNINLAAGNTFSNPPDNIWHIFKDPNSVMVYYYDQNSLNHNPTQTNFSVNPTVAPTNTCKPKIPPIVFPEVPKLHIDTIGLNGGFDKEKGDGKPTNDKKSVKTNNKIKQVFNQQIKLIPNPTKGKFSIEIQDEISGNGWIQVFDLSGKKVMGDIFYPNNVTSINLEELAPALYIISSVTKLV